MPPMAPAPMPAMEAVMECIETAVMPASDASVAADVFGVGVYGGGGARSIGAGHRAGKKGGVRGVCHRGICHRGVRLVSFCASSDPRSHGKVFLRVSSTSSGTS